MFKVTVLDSQRVLFEGEANRVFLPGDTGEFEVLELHKPLISLLKEGMVVIDGDQAIPISSGIVRVRKDELVVLVEK